MIYIIITLIIVITNAKYCWNKTINQDLLGCSKSAKLECGQRSGVVGCHCTNGCTPVKFSWGSTCVVNKISKPLRYIQYLPGCSANDISTNCNLHGNGTLAKGSKTVSCPNIQKYRNNCAYNSNSKSCRSNNGDISNMCEPIVFLQCPHSEFLGLPELTYCTRELYTTLCHAPFSDVSYPLRLQHKYNIKCKYSYGECENTSVRHHCCN